MALSPSVLATGLLQLVPTTVEADAATALAAAYADYMSNAMALVPITPLAINAGKAAITSSLVGMSAPNGASLVITNALIAFWGALVASPPVTFPGALALTPPPFAASVPALNATFASNLAGRLSFNDAVNAIALVIHGQSLGGTATFPSTPPIVTPII